jgi:hypothetical protein
MNDRQRDKLTMYVMVRDFLLGSTAITSRWAGFAALFASFVKYIADLFNVSGAQKADKSGESKSKSKLRGLLIEQMVDISGKCIAYAGMAKDYAFESPVGFTKSELQMMADADLLKTAQTFYTNVMTKLPLVADYDLTQQDMDDLEGFTNDFNEVFTKPKANRKTTALLTAQIKTLFALADEVLDTIDKLVNSIHKKEPAFVDEYNKKRIIVKTPSRTRAWELTVLNDETGEPLPKAKVTVTGKSSGADLVKTVKRSGKQGGVIQDVTADGEYEYEVEYNGCIKEKGTFFINNGVTTKVVVRMKKGE